MRIWSAGSRSCSKKVVSVTVTEKVSTGGNDWVEWPVPSSCQRAARISATQYSTAARGEDCDADQMRDEEGIWLMMMMMME